MKTSLRIVVLTALTLAPLSLLAQSTAFTYQGRLDDNGSPADGIYDLRFSIYDASTSGAQQGSTLTSTATPVTNGLFTVTLDFGNQFPGADRWLEIGVRTNGGGAFSTLTPRQPLTATPYAVQAVNAGTASSVTAANISGTINLAQLPPVVLTNGAGGVTLSGTLSGNGSGITNVLLTTLDAPGFFSWPGNFTVASSPPVGNVPRSVVASDVNGDGALDLISANSAANTLTVLTNTGNGSFELRSTYSVPFSPRSVTAADVNGDGDPDLICTRQSPGGVIVLTNTGNGGFVAVSTNTTSFAGSGNVQMVVAADINGDATPDLITANGGSTGTLSLFTNDGSGGFALASSNSVGNNPFAVVAADVNNDTFVDLISANNNSSGTLSVLLNNGSGVFAAAIHYTAGDSPRSVVAADVNGDNYLDLISANVVGNTFSVLLNNGSGAFLAPLSFSAGNSPVWVSAVDLNADGDVDLICANNTTPGTLTAVTNNGSGIFQPAFTSSVGNFPYAVIAEDVNADDHVDLVSANGTSPGSLSVLFNMPSLNGTFVGNGSGLTNLNVNASTIVAGTLAEARIDPAVARDSEILPTVLAGDGSGSGLDADLLDGLEASAFWKTGGNTGTTAGTHFVGTTDNQPLELKVNGLRALRIENNGDSADGGTTPDGAPNLIAGSPRNFVVAGVVGATIGGGGATNYSGIPYTNSVLADFGVVGGGFDNAIAAGSLAATIAGGRANDIGTNSDYSTVGGGDDNNIATNSFYATIPGGVGNNIGANSSYSTIGGGEVNTIAADSFDATIAGGSFNDIGANSDYSAIGGGQDNDIATDSFHATITGGAFNDIGTNSDYSAIGGGADNTIAADSASATIAGGRDNDIGAISYYSAIGGGYDNDIAAYSAYATIAGGVANDIGTNSSNSTIGGGSLNAISSNSAYATIPGGDSNSATNYAFAAGRRAKANHQGAFVWGDSTAADISSTNNNSWTVRAAGGVRFFSSADATAGVFLAPNGTSWSTISDRNAKKNFHPVDVQAVLEKLAHLPMQQWNYNWEADDEVPHLGPMAQDFKGAFYPGRDDKSITTQEMDGVALAAIQGLNEKTGIRHQKSEDRILKLEAENGELKKRLQIIEQLLADKLNGGSK